MRALDVFSLSMKCIKNDLLGKINKFISGEVFAEDIEFVLTVPAIWGDIGKMLMREAAVQVSCKLVNNKFRYNPCDILTIEQIVFCVVN